MWRTIIKNVNIETGEVLDHLPKSTLKTDYILENSYIKYENKNDINYKIITNEYKESRQLKINFN